MQHHLIVEFWEEVEEILRKQSIPEAMVRKEISRYLRDLEQHGAEIAVYHFGSDEAATAIRNRMAITAKRSRTARQSKKPA